MASRASVSVRSMRSPSLWMKSVITSTSQEIREELLTDDRHDRFGMELNPLNRIFPVPETPDDSILRLCADFQCRRYVRYYKRVISGGGKTLRQTAEHRLG